MRKASLLRLRQGFFIHECEHQDLRGIAVDGDGRYQTVFVEARHESGAGFAVFGVSALRLFQSGPFPFRGLLNCCNLTTALDQNRVQFANTLPSPRDSVE